MVGSLSDIGSGFFFSESFGFPFPGLVQTLAGPAVSGRDPDYFKGMDHYGFFDFVSAFCL
jgi:hypothetical protein